MLRSTSANFNQLLVASSGSVCRKNDIWLNARKEPDWERYRTAIYHLMVRRLNKNIHDAEDVAQEAMLNVFRFLHTYRGDSAFTTWLFAVSIRSLIDWLRRQSRHITRREPLHDNTVAPVSDLQGGYEMHELITVALQQLRSRDRQIIVQFYFHSRSHKEIAAEHDIAVKTVSTRLTKAKRDLRRQFAQLGFADEFSEIFKS